MKKNKIYLIVMILFVVSGCSNVKYNMNINLNHINESLIFNHNINGIEDSIKDSINHDPELENYEFNVTERYFSIERKIENTENLSNDKIIGMLYNKVIVSKEGQSTTISLTDYNDSIFVCGEFDDNCSFNTDKITVKLISEYEILSSNADKVDNSKNEYTWELDLDYKPIYITYSDKIRWDVVIKNFILRNASLFVGLACLFVVLIVALIFVIKFFKARAINNS